jgi:multicomponent Na+:H+ antiporter subunit E
LLTNLLLALCWAALTGHFTLDNLFVGLVMGYLVLSLQHREEGTSSHFRKGLQLLVLFLHFNKALIVSNLRVAHDVLTPRYFSRPGIVSVPLDAKTDFEITLLANLVSLTPGTLSLDVADDRSALYVHVMFVDDIESVRRSIKEEVERPLLELMR